MVARLRRRRPALRARRRSGRRHGRGRLRASPERDRGHARGGARALRRTGARAVPAAPLLPHAPPRCESSARRSRRRTPSASRTCTPAREQPVDGVDGRIVVAALAPGVRAGWAPSVEDGVAVLAGLGATGRRRTHDRGRRRRSRRTAAAGGVACDDRGGRCARPPHHDRHRRARRGRSRVPGRSRSSRRLFGGRPSASSASRWSGSGRTCSWPTQASTRWSLRLAGELGRGRSARRDWWSRAAGRRTPCASTARARPASAASSSRARSLARPAAASG